MTDRWGPDPTYRLWERWRRPFLLLGVVLLVDNQWERFASGQPFAVVTGVGVAAFWITVIFSRSTPEPERRTEAEAWRTLARRRLVIFGSWTLAAVGWLGVAALLYSVRPLNFVGPALPLLLTALAWWTHRKADRIAELQRQAIKT